MIDDYIVQIFVQIIVYFTIDPVSFSSSKTKFQLKNCILCNLIDFQNTYSDK